MVPKITDRAQFWASKFGFEQVRSLTVFPHLSDETQGSADLRTLVKLLADTDLSRSRAAAVVALFENMRDPESPGSEVRYGHLFAVPAGELLALFRQPFYVEYAMSTNEREPLLSQRRFAFLAPSAVEEAQREKDSVPSKDGAYYYPVTYRELAGKLTLSEDIQQLLLPIVLQRFLLSGDYASATYVRL